MPDFGLIERYKSMLQNGESAKKERLTLKEALSSPDLSQFLRTTVIDVLKDSAEPLYVASKMFSPVRITEGRTIIFPAMSDIIATEVNEGSSYSEQTPEVEAFESDTEISVKKIGTLVKVTDEMISDSQWDVIGVLLQKAGRAMARYQEEWCFREFNRHGHIIFDPEHANAKFHTHGLGADRTTPNNTLSVEDFIDLMIGNLANGFTTTDIMMHPLVWPVFAKNPLLDKMSVAAFAGPGNNVTISPDMVQGKLPFNINITLTPFVPFNHIDRKFDMFVVDRNEVGIMLIKEDLTTEQWDNPDRDIRAMKFRQRYAPGVLRGGRAISVAKNIAFAQTYAEPEIIKMLS